jgi:hypothetical protein
MLQLFFIYPKALRMRTYNGDTPLHMACRSNHPSLELIQLLDSECPILWLLNNCYGSPPYHESVHRRRPAAALDFLLEATKQAAGIFEYSILDKDTCRRHALSY